MFDLIVVGAGVVGLATARQWAAKHPGSAVAVIEKEYKIGQGVSSRNSEVVHAGIYYSEMPVKQRTCIRGRELLYDWCQQHGVDFRKTGKAIVAPRDSVSLSRLAEIQQTAGAAGVPIQQLASSEIERRWGLKDQEGLWSPESGIVDSHGLMDSLERDLRNRGGEVFFHHQVLGLENGGESLLLRVRGPDGDEFEISTRRLVNAGGLGVLKITAPQIRSAYRVEPCRGRYFSLSGKWRGKFSELVYPLPDPKGGLGVHITLDLAGNLRLGPDVDWSMRSADPESRSLFGWQPGEEEKMLREFLAAGRRLIPALEESDLCGAYIGVRPKLFFGSNAVKDFVFEMPAKNELHLLGIESPGLTAALAIAEEVVQKLGS